MNDLTLTKRCQRKRRKNRTKKRNALWGQRYREKEREREIEVERCILVDISAKRLDPADNLNLLRAPSRVSQPASLPALLHLPPPSLAASVCILKWQTIIRTWGPSSLQKRDPRELPLCHKCRRQAEAQADADAEAEAAAWWKRQKLMDVYAGSTGIATVQQSLSPLCVCVLPLCASLCRNANLLLPEWTQAWPCRIGPFEVIAVAICALISV